MLQWDLSDTPLAKKGTPAQVPTEGELLALLVGLLLLEGVAYRDLVHRDLELRDEDRESLVQLLEYRLPELAREYGGSVRLRQRLSDFVGTRMMRPVRESPGASAER